MWRGLTAVMLAVVFGYGIVVAIMYATQSWHVYHPAGRHYAEPTDIGLDYEDVTLTTEDGTELHAWFIPAEPSRGVVLFLQGNSVNLSYRLEYLRVMDELGFSTLILDYRGYGKSKGEPDEEGTYQDAMAGWRYLTETRDIPPEEIVVYGQSLGASVASWLTAQETPGAVILESPFTSVMDVASQEFPFLPVRTLFKYEYDTLGHASQIQAPVLVIHREDDPTISFEHAEEIYAAVRSPKELLPLRGTKDETLVLKNRDYVDGMDRFLATHLR